MVTAKVVELQSVARSLREVSAWPETRPSGSHTLRVLARIIDQVAAELAVMEESQADS
jgi:hypothetical protein